MMEPKHKLLLNTIPTQIKDAFALPKEKQRLLWYTHKIQHKPTWTIVSYFEADERLIYSETDITARMAGHLYPQRTARKGFTLDKKTKKLQMWYLSQPSQLRYLHLLLKEIGKEWLVNEGFLHTQNPLVTHPQVIHSWLTKGLLEKVLLDKVTNPHDAAKYIIKANRFKGAVPKYLKQYIKAGNPKLRLLMYNNNVTDINAVIQSEGLNVTGHAGMIHGDILNQAKALGRKIDLTWSRKRMDEVHNEWTRELMEAELSLLEDEAVDYTEDFSFLPPQIELIRDRKRLFVEGKQMSHCVYTNYWPLVEKKKYMVWHVQQDNGDPITAGIRINSSGYYLEQAYGLRNQITASPETREFLESILSSEQFENAMKREFWPYADETFKPYKNTTKPVAVRPLPALMAEEDDVPGF